MAGKLRAALLMAVTSGCGRIAFAPLPDTDGDASDGDATDANADAPMVCAQFGPWSAPVRIDALATLQDDWEPALHPSGSPLVYGSIAGVASLFEAPRNGSTFGPARALDEINDPGSRTGGAAWMPGGNELYFVSNRTGSLRLFTSTYSNGTFSAPALVPGLETVHVNAPTLSNDGLELYFDDDGLGPPGRVIRAERPSTTAPWTVTGVQTQLAPGASPYGWPFVTADSLTLYFEAGFPVARIYTATRTSVLQLFGPASEVTELTTLLAFSSSGFGDPFLTPDERTMFVSADDPANGTLIDLYMLTRSCQ